MTEYALNNFEWENRDVSIDGGKFRHLRFVNNIKLISNSLDKARSMIQELKD